MDTKTQTQLYEVAFTAAYKWASYHYSDGSGCTDEARDAVIDQLPGIDLSVNSEADQILEEAVLAAMRKADKEAEDV